MHRRKQYICLILAFFLIILVLPGKQAEAAKKKKAYKVSFASSYGTIVLKKGKKKSLAVRCNKKRISASRLTWKSSKKSVVSVKNGRLTAKRSGSATISAKLKKGKSNTIKCKVYVYKKNSSTSFSVPLNSDGNYLLNKGKTLKLTPKKKGSYTTFTSSNKKVASVTKNGTVKGLKNGTVTITYTSIGTNRYKASIKIRVGKRITGISLDSEEEISLTTGEEFALNPKVTPSSATMRGLSYTSSNPEVATVTSKGVVKGKSEGMTRIKIEAKDGSGIETEARVYVILNNDRPANAGVAEITKTSQWVSHRGLNMMAPENTLPAFELAGKYGFSIIECDIHETKDGVLVISHDDTLERMCGVDKLISEMTLEEIKQYPITGGENPEAYPDNRVPTLEEYIRCCNQYSCTPMIEVKDPISKTGLQTLYNMLPLSEKKPIVISFSEDILKELRRMNSELELQWVMTKLTASKLKQCQQYNWDVDLKYANVTQSVIKEVHEAGLKINLWTVNNKNIARLFYNWGADYISSDYKLF